MQNEAFDAAYFYRLYGIYFYLFSFINYARYADDLTLQYLPLPRRGYRRHANTLYIIAESDKNYRHRMSAKAGALSQRIILLRAISQRRDTAKVYSSPCLLLLLPAFTGYLLS